MGEATDKWEALKKRMAEQAAGRDERGSKAQDQVKAMYQIANDLTYPVDDEGNQMNIHWLIPMLSNHLARLGYRKHEDDAVIKQIPHPRAGQAQVAEDAVLYVPVDMPGIPPQALSPPVEAPEAPQPWRTKTHVTLDGNTIRGGP